MSNHPSARLAPVSGGWWSALLSEVKEPLSRALEIVGPHADEIHSAWLRILKGFTFNPGERRDLSILKPEAHADDLKSGNFEAYLLFLQGQGQALARRGVQEEHARAALFCHLESSLPYVVSEGENPGELAAALVRLASIGALALSFGYTSARSASWRSFGERERQRLSRDLHDEIGHHLVVLKLYLGLIAKELTKRSPAQIRRKIEEALTLVSQAIQAVRRLILDLGPGALQEVGFVPAVKLYAGQFTARTGVKIHVREMGMAAKLPSSHETALYRVLQGALSNVLQHARARRVRVTVGAVDASTVRMVIEDDGIGFDTAARQQAFGLAAMRERVTSLGGSLYVESRRAAPGKRRHGTRIEITLPVPQAGTA